MMNTRKLLLPLFAVLFGLATSAFAQTVTTEATVAKVTGAATVTMPDGSTTALTPGMKVPQGATIKTGADGDVYIESHAGYITSIKKDSEVAVAELSVTTEGGKVKEEKTLLDLKSGNLVAKLDPSKHAVNNYQVRTPKGVAAARGTVFTVNYQGRAITIAVVNGSVNVTDPSGRIQGGTIGAGRWVGWSSSGSTNFSDQPIGSGSGEAMQQLQDMLAVAVATVAVAAQNNIGGTTVQEAKDVAAAVLKSMPAAASTIGALISESTKGQDNTAVVEAIKSVVPAAQLSSFDTGVQTGTTSSSSTTIKNTDSSNNSTTTTPQAIDPSTVSRSN